MAGTLEVDAHQVAPEEAMETSTEMEEIQANGDHGSRIVKGKVSNGLHAVKGLTISLHNVSVEIVKSNGCNLFNFGKKEDDDNKRSKKILQNVTAVIKSGEMYGLMGPSGAGKTTLLDVISHRLKSPGKRSGDVLYDAHRPTMSEVRRDASYVEQSDEQLSSMGHFTVFECVLFAAMCKLPHDKWSKQQKMERVDQVLKQMSLTQAKGTVLGNPGVGLRGVSGGERKRVAISMGLLYNPRAIFLDEPTTGLDSAMAAEVMHIVKRQLQGIGCTLVVTIHQPSPVIFELLDQLLLLKAGKIIYCGAGGMDTCRHFEGLGYPYRQGYNIAEFLLETLTDKGASCDFALEYEKSEEAKSQVEAADAIWEDFIHQTKPGEFQQTPSGHRRKMSVTLAHEAEEQNLLYYANSPLREVWVLLRYRVAVKWRMGWFIASKLVIPIAVGGVYASFFNSLPKNFWGSFTTAGLLFVTVALAGFLSIAPLEDFKGEWPLVLRQRQDAYYRSSSYVWEKILQELPYGAMGALGFGCITYFVIGLKMTPYAFFFYSFASFVVNMVSTSIAFAIAANIHIDFLPQALATVWNTLNILVSGFFLPKCQIPKWWSWLYWISYQQWTWSALMINQFGDQSGQEEAVAAGECEASFESGAKCSDGIGSLLNRLPMLFQSFGFNGDGNQCTAMNNFTLNMFNLGNGSHSNQWLCLLWASLSLPVFLVLFYIGIWRSTRSRS
jgi:ABC-type multidrug transport system ATPase subunit